MLNTRLDVGYYVTCYQCNAQRIMDSEQTVYGMSKIRAAEPEEIGKICFMKISSKWRRLYTLLQVYQMQLI